MVRDLGKTLWFLELRIVIFLWGEKKQRYHKVVYTVDPQPYWQNYPYFYCTQLGCWGEPTIILTFTIMKLL